MSRGELAGQSYRLTQYCVYLFWSGHLYTRHRSEPQNWTEKRRKIQNGTEKKCIISHQISLIALTSLKTCAIGIEPNQKVRKPCSSYTTWLFSNNTTSRSVCFSSPTATCQRLQFTHCISLSSVRCRCTTLKSTRSSMLWPCLWSQSEKKHRFPEQGTSLLASLIFQWNLTAALKSLIFSELLLKPDEKAGQASYAIKFTRQNPVVHFKVFLHRPLLPNFHLLKRLKPL